MLLLTVSLKGGKNAMKSPYEILGVSPSATDDEIKQAYRALVKKYHPDNYAGSPLADLASEKMSEININQKKEVFF